MANTETMTVHRIIAELKTIDKRIEDKIKETTFCRANKHANKVIGGKPIADYMASVKNDTDSIMTLIARRNAMRRALMLSNAYTKVRINDREYTVAEAIEMKNHGIQMITMLRDEMVAQWKRQNNVVETENGNKLTEKVDTYIAQSYGLKDAKTADALQARADYIQEQSYDLLDPLDLKQRIEKLTDEIDKFRADVDAVLSASNATTMVTFGYDIQ